MLKHPSASLVVAAAALIFSLAGTAEASYLITRNSQVGPGTISGHNPPSRDHANIISGSVGTTDLHPGAVTQAKLAPLPAWTQVGSSGAPSFQSAVNLCLGECTWTWTNSTQAPNLTTAAFYRYQGVVYLKGRVCISTGGGAGCNLSGTETAQDSAIFSLPSGYRPAHLEAFVVPGGANVASTATLYIDPSTGNVVVRNFPLDGVSLDGISFRVNN